jgi:hypothetical protein
MNEIEPQEGPVAARSGAAILRAMADKLDLNAANGFGGAFVIIPPDGEIKELLMLNNSQDLPVFWSLVQSTAQIAIAELQDNKPQGFGRR